jgi:hypothetical protein
VLDFAISHVGTWLQRRGHPAKWFAPIQKQRRLNGPMRRRAGAATQTRGVLADADDRQRFAALSSRFAQPNNSEYDLVFPGVGGGVDDFARVAAGLNENR